MEQAEKLIFETDWHAEIYDTWYQSPTMWGDRDRNFWLQLAQESSAPILELACGTGRLTIPLARAGLQTVGLDRSEAMLNVARRKLTQEPPEVQQRLQLIHGDMSCFSLEERFGLIFIPFRSFSALLEKDAQRNCLRCCAEHLQPNGRLAINVFFPKLSLISQPGGRDIDFGSMTLPDGTVVRSAAHTDYDLANQRAVTPMRYEFTAPDGQVIVREHVLDLRYFFRFELEWMLEACGFEVEALYGNFDMSPLGADSPELIFVAKAG